MTGAEYINQLAEKAKALRPVDKEEEELWRASHHFVRGNVKASLFIAAMLHDDDIHQSWELVRHLALLADDLGITFDHPITLDPPRR